MKISTPFQTIEFAAATASRIEDCAIEAQRLGAVDLAVGSWSIPIPDCLIYAQQRAAKNIDRGYPALRGLDELRQSVARIYNKPGSITSITFENIFITPGATGALAIALTSLLHLGEEAITPMPAYSIFFSVGEKLGRKIRGIAVASEAHGHPYGAIDWAQLEKNLTPSTKVILLADPDNPSGRVLDKEDYRRLTVLLETHCNLWAIIDRTYEDFSISRTVEPTSNIFGPRTLLLGSISKSRCAASWRVGWILAAAELGDLLETSIEEIFGGVPTMVQVAAAHVLEKSLKELGFDVPSFARTRCTQLCSTLERAGLQPWPVQGGLFVCVPSAMLNAKNSAEAWRCLADRGVVGVPGTAFFPAGCISEHGFVRLCFARSQETITLAARRLLSADAVKCRR